MIPGSRKRRAEEEEGKKPAAKLYEDKKKSDSNCYIDVEKSSSLKGGDVMSEDEGEEFKDPEIEFLECGPDNWFEDRIICWGKLGRRELGRSPCNTFKTTLMPENYQLKMMSALDYLDGIIKLRTFFMYQRLKRNLDKHDIIDLMYLLCCEEPCSELFQRQESIIECCFRNDSHAKLYSNLIVVRHKNTGELVQVDKPFEHFRRCIGSFDEDHDEQFVKLHETLRNYMEKINGASLLKSDARLQTFDQFAEFISGDAFDKVATLDMLECIIQHIWFKVNMKLAEERKRAKISIWKLRSKVNADDLYDNKEALKLIHRLKVIDNNLFICEEFRGSPVPCPVIPPSEKDSWAALPLEERSQDEKWMEKIEEEHKQILCYVRGRMTIERTVEYIKLKMEVAKEMGIWRVPVEEYWEGMPEFFKVGTEERQRLCRLYGPPSVSYGKLKRMAEGEEKKGGYSMKGTVKEEEGEGDMSTKDKDDNDVVKGKKPAGKLYENHKRSDSNRYIEAEESNSLKGGDPMSEDESEEEVEEELKVPIIKFRECEHDDWFEPSVWSEEMIINPDDYLHRRCNASEMESKPRSYELKMVVALDYLNGICKLRTFFMYHGLKRYSDKLDIFGLMCLLRFECFESPEYIAECYFRNNSQTKLYSNLLLIRHKDTGAAIQVDLPFEHFKRSTAFFGEDHDEQFVKLHETLRNHMEKIEGASLLKRGAREETFHKLALFASKDDAFNKVETIEIFDCIAQHISFKVNMELAEERKRAKIIIWGLRSKGNADVLYADKEALKLAYRLDMIDNNLFSLTRCGDRFVPCPVKPPSEVDSWASLPLEERSQDEKWMEKIEEEHKQILCYVRERMTVERAVEYIKLKMEVAKEMGIWRVPVEEYWQGIPEFFKLRTQEWWRFYYPDILGNWSNKDEDDLGYENSNYMEHDIL